MTSPPDGPDTPGPVPVVSPRPRRWLVIVAAVAVVLLGVGWFLISYLGTHDDITDALTEGIGAALGLMIAISIVGAVLSARAGNRDSR
jgi:thiol:disulfide interchange protein